MFTRIKHSRTLVIDEVKGERGAPRTAYWWAEVPTDEMKQMNPMDYGFYRYIPTQKRRIVFGTIPLAVLLLTAASLYFYVIATAAQPVAVPLLLATALLVGVMGAIIIGLPIALVIVKLAMRSEFMYVVWRVTMAVARQLEIPANEAGYYTLVWVTPSVLHSATEADAQAMVNEAIKGIWQRELLNLGVDGGSRRDYLDAMGVQSQQLAKLWQRRNGNPSIDNNQNSINERPTPSGR
jgi:hypothetical protein